LEASQARVEGRTKRRGETIPADWPEHHLSAKERYPQPTETYEPAGELDRRIEQPKMRFIKRQLVWALVVLPLVTGCKPLEDLGKLIDDLLKRFTP
jgi:hypothetical protein